ncbi:glycoside hydrolase family 127 protein [Nitrospirillum sp. BR 11164]|uniref:glycoside hydrolase family 127 protein n=1 Tax=Nitrospirillum sp. BR 11164 TaxID=3104324 RepID=UPI002AFF0E9B|nr:beta-L-arabinofuranosidase domain-containing protein [Nitrospirillum sp. BR 11164]MEA1648887.1 glycoside hydrolase family 127 protein [Nitrospirillum sp. BR 11164]
MTSTLEQTTVSVTEAQAGPIDGRVTPPDVVDRRRFLAATGGGALAVGLAGGRAALAAAPTPVNLAVMARTSWSNRSSGTRLAAINTNAVPTNSKDDTEGAFATEPHSGPAWIEYSWDVPVRTNVVDVYWWLGGWKGALPTGWRVSAWDGKRFVPVRNAQGLGLAPDTYNRTTFDPVTTTRLRLDIDPAAKSSVGVLQWRVWSHGAVPVFPPLVTAGQDRAVVLGGQTYLDGRVRTLDAAPSAAALWHKVSGPGSVSFADATRVDTTARFSAPGEYVLQLSAKAGGKTTQSTLKVRAETPPPNERLDVVYTTPYAIDSPLWSSRAKALITRWIPHCIDYCERTDLKIGQGGLDNFIEAGKALRGEPHGTHKGYVFSNAWVHQTVESMCIALMVDPQGDTEIIAAQDLMRRKLGEWIPVILAAQEPDGYLQTAYTLADRAKWPARWSPEQRGNHEGYVAGYFIESAINHHTLTGGKDLRLYNAAKKLADCWVANIGPGKKEWFDGHQEMEQALVRFGRFVNDMEGQGHGDAYIRLARFLLDSRRGGSEYDQSHLPPGRQYEAVGHAVRAMYFYSGMADIAAETRDIDYQSAVLSLWDNMVNKKYYVTGGVGSGDTAEGFGENYALRNDAYCESCSSCGLIFFQYKLNIAYHDAKYADLYEETMYNALLGSTALDGQTFCYTNPLVDTERTTWHVCPCCVGNIPRTLLMVPTWAYAKDKAGVNVNLFIGSRVNVGDVAGTAVEMVQKTNYPWEGAVALTVNPAKTTSFAVRIRVPDRATSALYAAVPPVRGLESLTVNGKAVRYRMEKGYAVVEREWAAGDRVDFVLPLAVQRVTGDDKVEATRGKVALRYGPLVYNVEKADQPSIDQPLAAAPVTAEWRPDLLGGVVALKGQWQDGTPMLAIPNYARMNRLPSAAGGVGGTDSGINYAIGAQGQVVAADATGEPEGRDRGHARHSQVWIAVA